MKDQLEEELGRIQQLLDNINSELTPYLISPLHPLTTLLPLLQRKYEEVLEDRKSKNSEQWFHIDISQLQWVFLITEK